MNLHEQESNLLPSVQDEDLSCNIGEQIIRLKSQDRQDDSDLNNQINNFSQQDVNNEFRITKSKKKAIVKKQKKPQKKQKKNKPPKRVRGEQYKTIKNRPQNTLIQKEHLLENKSYNDLIYHYSRFLIFIKLKQEDNFIPFAMHFTNEQHLWVSQTTQIMNKDNFPAYTDDKPIFLLHPSSIHFVFKYRLQKQNKVSYSLEQLKYIMFAFLIKKNLLSESFYNHIQQFWTDIIYLVNNPKDDQKMYDREPKDQFMEGEEADMPQNQEDHNQNRHQNTTGKRKAQTRVSQIDLMKKELADDNTIIAYEIACYLHSCCQKFKIRLQMQ